MPDIIELELDNKKDIYKQLAKELSPFRERPVGSLLFIVEKVEGKPLIGIRYPGRKFKKRELKTVRSNSALWANLYDFEVVPFRNGKEIESKEFTFTEIMKDYKENKAGNEDFWDLIEEIYYKNSISKELPDLPGIEPRLYLLMLKWIWIQEDFNYRLGWEDVKSPIRYVLETRTGNRTSKGAGRAKFFAALILLKHHFTFEEVKKIIPLY